MLNKFFEGIGRFILDGLWFIGDVILLWGEALRQMPKKIRWNHVLAQMAHLGVDSLPIVLLTLLSWCSLCRLLMNSSVLVLSQLLAA